ncbi:MAG: Gfo/Idh/MocA family oxidoreductase, partial [Limnochordia bacterium]|nr:Gfo/Idh/MocA family oxidoreductase [Limnochordia bacterium]
RCMRRCGNPGGWFMDKSRSGGGPLIDLGVHMVDLAWYLAGKPNPLAVSAVTFGRIGFRDNIKGYDWYKSMDQDVDVSTVEDQAVALIRFEGGFALNLDVSFDQHIKEDVIDVNIYGNRGGFALYPHAEFFTGFGPYLADLQPKVKPEDFGGMFRGEINHFVNCIQGKEQCISTIDDGLVVMKILDAVYRSAEQGKEVPVE